MSPIRPENRDRYPSDWKRISDYHAGYVDGKRHAEHTLIRDHGD